MQCTCISIFSKIRLVDQSKLCTQIHLQIIINCINLQLAIRISRNHSFQTWVTQFSRSKPILRSNDYVDLLEPRSKVISTDYGHVRIVSRNIQSDVIYNTRCTRGDASSFFSVLTKRMCMHKTKFLMNIFKYCSKNYIKLHEFANCNSANYDI